METFNIPKVEVFSAGTWNGDEYTIEDLNAMVDAFTETKSGIPPFIKLGHSEGQELLEGMPAAGWIDRLYVVGDKLVADFVDIPKSIYNLIVNKAYRKVSSEIFWNLKIGEKVYKRVLGAVALLGAETPGVMNLKDILSMYKKFHSQDPPKIYANESLKITLPKQGEGRDRMEKTEQEIRLEAELEAKKQEAIKYSADLKATSDELADLKKYKSEAEAEKAKLVLEAEVAKREKLMSELISEKLCTPGMKPYVEALLGEQKKSYSIDKKELTKEELLKQALVLFKAAASVNFEESSEDGEEKNQADESKQIEDITKYAKENNVSYSVAAKAVLKKTSKK